VPFPFDDLASSKVRPAVCLTDPVGPHRLVTATATLIRRELGYLSPGMQAHVGERLRVLFDLKYPFVYISDVISYVLLFLIVL
jgi:hypothetical protein